MKFLLPLLLLGSLIADCTVQCETLPGTCSSECVSQSSPSPPKERYQSDIFLQLMAIFGFIYLVGFIFDLSYVISFH